MRCGLQPFKDGKDIPGVLLKPLPGCINNETRPQKLVQLRLNVIGRIVFPPRSKPAQLPLNSPKSQQPITNNGCSKRSKRQDTGEAGVKGWRSAEPHIGSPAAETRKAE